MVSQKYQKWMYFLDDKFYLSIDIRNKLIISVIYLNIYIFNIFPL